MARAKPAAAIALNATTPAPANHRLWKFNAGKPPRAPLGSRSSACRVPRKVSLAPQAHPPRQLRLAALAQSQLGLTVEVGIDGIGDLAHEAVTLGGAVQKPFVVRIGDEAHLQQH